jgi:hypothetical protein
MRVEAGDKNAIKAKKNTEARKDAGDKRVVKSEKNKELRRSAGNGKTSVMVWDGREEVTRPKNHTKAKAASDGKDAVRKQLAKRNLARKVARK